MNFQFRLRGLAPPPGVFAIEFVPFVPAPLSVVFAVDPFADDFTSASDDMVNSTGRGVELPMQGRSLLRIPSVPGPTRNGSKGSIPAVWPPLQPARSVRCGLRVGL